MTDTCGWCGVALADLDFKRAPEGHCSAYCAERYEPPDDGERRCPTCGHDLNGRRPHARFDTDRCRVEWPRELERRQRAKTEEFTRRIATAVKARGRSERRKTTRAT
jgi:hypothetical protein